MPRGLSLICCMTVLAALQCGTSLGQTAPTKPAPLPPLTRMQVESLFAAGVNRLDILNEANQRYLDFDVTADVLAAWEKLGVDSILLNKLPTMSRETLEAFVRAMELVKAKNYKDAAKSFGQILQPDRSPRCMDALHWRARCFRQLKDFDAAQTDFVKYLQFEPRDVGVNLELGSVLAEAGKLEEAEKLFLQVLNDAPEQLATVHGRLASLRIANGQYSQAIDDLLNALQAGPGNPELLTQLAFLHGCQPGAAVAGDLAAREFARAAVLLTPDGSQPPEADPKADDAVKQDNALRIVAWKGRRLWSSQAEALLAALDGQFPKAKELQEKAVSLAQALGEEVVDKEGLNRISEIHDSYAAGKRFQFQSTKTGKRLISTLDSKGAAQLLATRLVRIAGGKFQMGSTNGAPDEKPVREVTVRPFRISSHEITHAEWAAVMRLPLAGNPDAAHEMVSWEDCQEFIRRLNSEISSELAVFRLPTEAEWEFAARGGTTTDFSFGDDANLLSEYGWHDKNSKNIDQAKSGTVGQLKKNPKDLYDMHGNVAEWCNDTYAPYPGSPSATSKSDSDVAFRVVRGGHRRQAAEFCRSSSRGFAAARDRLRGIGFRLAADSDGNSDTPLVNRSGGPSPKGLLSIIDQANNTRFSSLHPSVRREVETQVQLILGYVMFDMQNEKAALTAFEKAQNLASLPVGNHDFEYLVPNDWVLSICSRGWIYATSTNPDVRDAQRADIMANDAIQSTQLNNWLPYVVRAAANAAQKNWVVAKNWEDTALEQSTNPLSRVSVRVTEACKKRRSLYDDNKVAVDRGLPFPLDEVFFYPKR